MSSGVGSNMFAWVVGAMCAAAPAQNEGGGPGQKEAEAQAPAPASTKGRGWSVGAQTEFIGPAQGLAGLLVGHAFDGFQLEGNFALRIADDTLDEEEATNAYAVGLRGYWVVHETERADFALAAGGSFAFLEPPRGGLDYGG